jgi:signal transduction histidine kinase
MGGLTRTQGVGTLRTSWGFPYGALRGMSWADIALAAAVSASLVMALVAVGAASMGSADVGIVSNGAGSRVLSASPLGFGYRDGIRRGDLVVSVRGSDEDGGYQIIVGHGDSTVTSSAAPYDAVLRATTPVALLGLLASAVAFVLRARWPKGAWAAASIGVVLASTPLLVQGDPQVSTFGLGLATALPAAGLIAGRIRSPIGIVAILATVGFLAAWAVSRTLALDELRWFETQRSTIAFYLMCAVVVAAVIDLRRSAAIGWRGRTSSLDLAGAAAFVGVMVVLNLFVGVDWVILGALTLVVLMVYPRSRRAILCAADALVLGDVRRQAAIAASEGERARLAADLHDVPIQELSGVIARLELVEEAAQERDALRRIAAQLREVTTELRPPVLDDLGLPSAIEALADQYTREGTSIRVDVDDRTMPEQVRDPDVELAIYRVTEEALRNALVHADARRVDVTGVIAADTMEIEVRDDGRGLDRGALERARKAGHAGLIAMRQRAEAVGAQLSLRSEVGAGVSVLIAWNR